METGCNKAFGKKGMGEAARAVLSESKGMVVCLESEEHSDIEKAESLCNWVSSNQLERVLGFKSQP